MNTCRHVCRPLEEARTYPRRNWKLHMKPLSKGECGLLGQSVQAVQTAQVVRPSYSSEKEDRTADYQGYGI